MSFQQPKTASNNNFALILDNQIVLKVAPQIMPTNLNLKFLSPLSRLFFNNAIETIVK